MEKKNNEQTQQNKFLNELLGQVSNPIHKRLIYAYKGENPVTLMESELRKILLEVMENDN